MSAFDIDWSAPDYRPVLEFRQEALTALRAKPKALAGLKQFYSTSWVDFVNDWGMTYDPRKAENKYTPFILFPRQEEYIQWVYSMYSTGRRGLAEKSREVGFTWLSVACACCLWLFVPQSVVGFGSRKQELVDNGDADPDSIFWKVRAFLDHIPAEFLPASPRAGWKSMVVYNSDNKAVIKGEIGDEIGRGGRSGLYFVDEFAHLAHPEMAESALSANTDCRIYVSTVNGVGNLFYRLRHFLPAPQIFIFDWKDDPRKRLNPSIPPEQEPWYKKQAAELLPTDLASQVDRNYQASVANTFLGDISDEVVAATRRRPGSIDQAPNIPWRIGVDAAGQGNDDIVLWARRGRISVEPETYKRLDGIQLASIIERKVEMLLHTAPVELIAIERDGPGGSAADQLKYGPYASITMAIHTGAKLKDGRNYNLRAFLHSQAREYLKDLEVSLPDDNIFLAQAMAIQSFSKAGLLLIESKDDYRARFATGITKEKKAASRSPDRWDAFVLTFTPTRARPIEQKQIDDLFAGETSRGWRPLDAVIGY